MQKVLRFAKKRHIATLLKMAFGHFCATLLTTFPVTALCNIKKATKCCAGFLSKYRE